ncbi:MAG TPA: heavy metal-binding domain-containing protein, partial [Caulobacteraceae bacterium]|nr:heavy metal-binding domain-containing protein [Caulobacteraceae bacterium]
MTAISTRLVLAAGALALVAGGTGFSLAHLGQKKSAAVAAPSPAAPGGRAVLYWYDPMRPEQHFDKPGKSPFMDMQLVPKYADEGAAAAAGVRIDPATAQSLG